MTSILLVLLIIACIILSFLILIQKPKGGGLSGSFGSLGTQVMGVKQSGDVMEKGTWYTMTIVAVISVFTAFTLNIKRAPAASAAPTEQNVPAAAPESNETAPVE